MSRSDGSQPGPRRYFDTVQGTGSNHSSHGEEGMWDGGVWRSPTPGRKSNSEIDSPGGRLEDPTVIPLGSRRGSVFARYPAGSECLLEDRRRMSPRTRPSRAAWLTDSQSLTANPNSTIANIVMNRSP